MEDKFEHIHNATDKRLAEMIRQQNDYRKLGTTVTYALRRLNTGTPAKGFLFFTADFIDSPEAQQHLESQVKGWRTKKEAAQAKKKGLVSVVIDRKTTLLVPSEKWTPDYAERWKARMAASQPQ